MKTRIFSILAVALSLLLLGLAVLLLLKVAPKEKPQVVDSLDTAGVFDENGEPVQPDREQAYQGEITAPVVEEVPETPDQPPVPAAESQPADHSEDIAKARELLNSMSEEEKLWQLFFVRPEALTDVQTATRAGQATKDALEERPVGGVIYFSENLEDAEQTQEMLKNIQSYAKIPLFLGVDEEGGIVSRLGSNEKMGVKPLGSMESFARDGDSAALYAAMSELAKSMKALGFNMDFAPVADVRAGAGSVIGDRSFSTDPEICQAMVPVAVGALQDSGVVSCLKHFPGYGSTLSDDHNGAAGLNRSLEELETKDFLPFVSGIQKDAAFVMVSHLSAPLVTGDNTPSDLSEKIVSEILRNKLDFRNVIITDAQEMKSITDNYSSGEAAVKALQAGVDMILMPGDLMEAYAAVEAAVADGTLSRERIDESVLRILTVKAHYGLLPGEQTGEGNN